MSENKALNSISKSAEWIATVFAVLLLTIYPLYYHNYYFDILVTKYKAFYLSTILVSVILLLLLLAGAVMKKFDGTGSSDKAGAVGKTGAYDSWFAKMDTADIAAIAFWVIALISTIQSDFKYESFWGNEGRLNGLFLTTLYMMTYFIISRGVRYGKWLIELFLIASMLICLFGITDYFKLDILKFKEQIDPNQYNMFMSTIGNLNTYTAYVAMVMGISAVLFMSAKSFLKALQYFIYMVISFFAIIMGLSDNSYLAAGALLALSPLWFFKNRLGVKRYLIVLTSFICSIYFSGLINKSFPDHVLQMGGLLEKISGFGQLKYIAAALVIFCLAVYAYDFVRRPKGEYGGRLQIVWGCLLLLALLCVLYVLYDANIGGNKDAYGSLGNYLILNDDWGTHRGYAWRVGVEEYMDQPLIHKIFGSGPETFGLLALDKKQEMIKLYNEYFDSAHNEYLQYFLTMGPFGLISYLTFLAGAGIQMMKRAKEDPYLLAIFFAVICYAVQAFVNINVPITAPVFLTLIAVGLAGSRKARMAKPD